MQNLGVNYIWQDPYFSVFQYMTVLYANFHLEFAKTHFKDSNIFHIFCFVVNRKRTNLFLVLVLMNRKKNISSLGDAQKYSIHILNLWLRRETMRCARVCHVMTGRWQGTEMRSWRSTFSSSRSSCSSWWWSCCIVTWRDDKLKISTAGGDIMCTGSNGRVTIPLCER